jgi:hypothetical protein
MDKGYWFYCVLSGIKLTQQEAKMQQRTRIPKAITLMNFQEELLPSGRKLLHGIFKSQWADELYRWTPPWRDKPGQYGVERLFFKALEVEEWNDPDGVWNEELKKAAEDIPPLKDMKVPVRVECSRLTALKSEHWGYKIDVSILGDDEKVSGGLPPGSFQIGRCSFNHERFKDDFLAHFSGKWGLSIGKTFERLWEGPDYAPEEVGIAFSIWIPNNLDRVDYRSLGRELAYFVRSYIRRTLSDYRTIKSAFES